VISKRFLRTTALQQLKLLKAVYNAIASLQQELRETKQVIENQLFEGRRISDIRVGGHGLPSSRMAEQFRRWPFAKDSPKAKKK
jgi:hypothetical protein